MESSDDRRAMDIRDEVYIAFPSDLNDLDRGGILDIMKPAVNIRPHIEYASAYAPVALTASAVSVGKGISDTR